MSKDYYKTLGVAKNATKEEIKKAYKTLAKKHHPDISKEADASEKFKELNEAAAVLGDDQKRSQYDQFGDADQFKQASGFDAGASGFDFSDFASFDFGDIFDRFFGGGGGRGRRQQSRGSDLRFDMEISLEEAAFGAEKNIRLPRNETCAACKGSGAKSEKDIEDCPDCNGRGVATKTQRTPFGIFQSTATCARCKGGGKYIKVECDACDATGVVHKNDEITVTIPKGAEEGTNLRVTGKGEAGQRGASAGDLYIVLHMKEHKTFHRQGDDIYLKVAVGFAVAAMGGEVEVPTLEGNATLKIPAGTQSNTVFRIRSKGIPFLHNSGAGDELVEVVVDVPEKLSRKQRKLLQDFAKEDKKSFLAKVFS